MKNSLVWVVLLGFALTLASCGGKDPDPISPIVGTWTLSKYKMVNLPVGFKKAEGYEDVQILGIEVGYTLVFNADGTYTRAYNVGGNYTSIYDKGKYTLDGSTLKLSPNNPSDLDLIELYGTVGTSFTLVDDITDIRLFLENTEAVTVYLLSDDFDTTKQPTNDDFKKVDITLQYKFNKL